MVLFWVSSCVTLLSWVLRWVDSVAHGWALVPYPGGWVYTGSEVVIMRWVVTAIKFGRMLLVGLAASRPKR